MNKRFGLSPTLQKGKDGVFEVTYGDELIFSKRQLGRFPEPGEVEGMVENRVA